MTGCVIPRRGIYYVRLTYYDMNHRRRDKWVSTGLSGRGAKQKATAMIDQMIEQYSYLETNAHPTKMAEYLLMWKEIRRTEVAESTFDSWNTYINRHLVPYFEELNLNIQDITPRHILDYMNYLSHDGGRKDFKVGGQSALSVRKIIGVLRQVLDYAVLHGDIKFNPALQVPLPKKTNKKDERQVFLTAEDAQKMLDAFRDEEIGPIIFVTLYYGLRRSEALGLRWQAVDFDANTISINHTVVGGSQIVAKDSTKSYCSMRTYELLPDVKDQLLEKLTITVPLDALDKTLVMELSELTQKSPGKTELCFNIVDNGTKQAIGLKSTNTKISVSRELISFINQHEELEFRIN